MVFSQKICEGNDLKVVGEENLSPGPDGKDDPFLIRTWLENSQKYPETLEPEENAGPSTEKATTYASQPSPSFQNSKWHKLLAC